VKQFIPALKQENTTLQGIAIPSYLAVDSSQAEFPEAHFQPIKKYQSIELFAGAGGLAIGLERAGFHALALNEFNKDACHTLRLNRPLWNVLEGDIQQVDFSAYRGVVDFVSGGFPCQAFSYAGNQRGFADTRGTLFFEFARAIQEMQPKVFLAENVRGLLAHDDGKTLATIKAAIADLGYTLVEPRVLKAIFHRVPQKRERLFLVGIRNDLLPFAAFNWPTPAPRVMVLRDALKAGELYASDVPDSAGQAYPARKKAVLDLVPAGGYWRDLPDAVQREYMQKSYFLGGGKTGMARRLSWDEPSLTLTCSPAQNQTERCHPDETRPLKIREYARIQTFPDSWQFAGSVSSQYKQIGNAVPVNLAHAMGRSLVALLNSIKARVVQQSRVPVTPQALPESAMQLPLFRPNYYLDLPMVTRNA
jgi:DNA (cytosine-5)-methyltransferase 1